MERTLWASIERLAPLAPRFVSVTYGADGSTRERTHNDRRRASCSETPLTPRAAPDLHRRAARARSSTSRAATGTPGVRHIVALRGDAPGRPGRATGPHPDGFAYAARPRRAACKTVGDFDISVAAYPEMHPEAPSAAVRPRQAQAPRSMRARSRAITQFFFDTDAFLRFRDRCAARGIDAPSSCRASCRSRGFRRCCSFAKRCGASVPDWLAHRFDGLDDDPETRRMIAASVAIEQVRRLQEHGVHEFHFYTLNRAELTYRDLPRPRRAPRPRSRAATGA